MPRIADHFADSAVYLYSSEQAAKAGQNAGGSGFLVNVPVPGVPGMGHIYAVTNRHLVDGSDDGKFWTLRLTRKGGGTDCINTQKNDWFLHEDGDDVAILPLGLKDGLKWWAIPTDKFTDKEGIDVYGIGYGDEVFLVGRLISQSGVQKNTPVARFGTIALAADASEPIKYRGREQEAFLIECHSISGFSGSPVFVMTDRFIHGERMQRVADYEKRRSGGEDPPQDAPGMKITITSRDGRIGPLLIGIDFGHISMRSGVYQKNRKLDYEVETNTGIAGVVPVWKITELIMTPKLVAERAEEDAALQAKMEGLPETFVLDVAKEHGENFTMQDFEVALTKASRRISPSESGREKK